MGKLSATQIDDYFSKHLPYRTRIMVTHYRMTHDRVGNPTAYTADPGQVDAAFVAALVTARMYINVLGVGKSGGGFGEL